MKHLVYLLTALLLALSPLGMKAQEYDPMPTDFFAGEEPVPINLEATKAQMGYPQVAMYARIQGRVIVRVLVDKEGKYLNHIVLKADHPILGAHVERHLHLMRFKPAMQKGKPVKVWVTIPFDFRLAGPPASVAWTETYCLDLDFKALQEGETHLPCQSADSLHCTNVNFIRKYLEFSALPNISGADRSVQASIVVDSQGRSQQVTILDSSDVFDGVVSAVLWGSQWSRQQACDSVGPSTMDVALRFFRCDDHRSRYVQQMVARVPSLIDDVPEDMKKPQVLNLKQVEKLVGYPESWKSRGKTGFIQFFVLVDQKGQPSQLLPSFGCDSAIWMEVQHHLEALRFNPANLDDVPMMAWTQVRLDVPSEQVYDGQYTAKESALSVVSLDALSCTETSNPHPDGVFQMNARIKETGLPLIDQPSRSIRMLFEIDAKGKVTTVVAENPAQDSFEAAALRAAKGLYWSPAYACGKAVSSKACLTLTFTKSN